MALQFVITTAGREAIVNAANDGTAAITITEIALGSGYAPATAARTALTTEIKRLPAAGGGTVAPDTIHVTGRDTSSDEYAAKEIGLYTSTGILLAIYANATAFLTKGAATVGLLACDLIITGLPAGSVTVGDITFANPPATETVRGVAEIATQAETEAGTDDERFITPKKLAGLFATAARRGIVRLATALETITGTDAEKAITPAGLAAVTSTTLRRGLIKSATSGETATGTATDTAVTPAALAALTSTNARRGIIQTATGAETIAGTDTEKAITPAGLSSLTATTSRRGLAEIATNEEAAAGVSADVVLTPAHMAVLKTEIAQLFYPVGEMLITRREGNPATWLGFGSWERYGAGRTLVGYQAADADFDALDKTGGSKTITLSAAEIPGHTHSVNPPETTTSSNGSHSHFIAANQNVSEDSPNVTATSSVPWAAGIGDHDGRYFFKASALPASLGLTNSAGSHNHTLDIAEFNSASTGGGGAHSNVQPFIVVYMWKRTS